MQLKVSVATTLFPTEIHAAEDHPPDSMPVEYVLQPAVRLGNVDLGELARESRSCLAG